MSRPYTMKRRAARQARTRQRIVEAAVALHGSVGPARTTVSMVAERAGVQRHTFYAHFPDDLSLSLACSGLVAERDPLPDAAPWRAVADRDERLRVALTAIYGWYARNASLMACVLRDAEHHTLTQEIVALRFGKPMAAWREALGDRLSATGRALLELALSFHTWRTLTRDAGLDRDGAIAAMVEAVEGAG